MKMKTTSNNTDNPDWTVNISGNLSTLTYADEYNRTDKKSLLYFSVDGSEGIHNISNRGSGAFSNLRNVSFNGFVLDFDIL